MPEDNVHLALSEQLRYFRAIDFLRRHPVHAVYLLFGIILAPHQRIAYRKMWRAKVIGLKLSRGMSKTFLDGLFPVHKGLLWSGATSVAIGKDFRRGKMIFNESISPIIASSLSGQEKRNFALLSLAKTANIINRGSDLWTCKYKHSSSISTGPLGIDTAETSPLRGLRANAGLILDEAADISGELYTSVIRPFGRVARDPIGLNITGDDFVYSRIESGTVRYDFQRFSQFLQETENKMRAGNKNFVVIEFNYEDAFYRVGNKKDGNIVFSYKLNLEDILEELNSGFTSMDDFLSENKNIIQLTKDREFSPKLIEAVIGTDIPLYWSIHNERFARVLMRCEDPVVIGIDPARESADFGLVVIRPGPLRAKPVEYNDIIYAKTMFQKEFGEMYDEIRSTLDRYPNCLLVVMDAGGGGRELRDRLWRPADNKIPIYDMLDESTPIEVKQFGSPLLRLDDATNEKNTVRANFCKAQFQTMKLLFPDHEDDYEAQDTALVAKTIKQIGRQFSYIIGKPSGNWKKYEVGEKRLKKDLFSATLLAMSGVYDILQGQESKEEVHNEYETM